MQEKELYRIKEGKWLAARVGLILFYVTYVMAILFIGMKFSFIAPLLAFIPISLWIIVFITWRYVSVEYEYSLTSGTLTFTNAKKPREVAAALPKDKVLIETDCPYLTPHPHRGKINHSGYLAYTNATLASIFGVSEEECARITEENARRMLGI